MIDGSSKEYKYLIDCFKTMNIEEIAYFKVKFASEKDNHYLTDSLEKIFLSPKDDGKIDMDTIILKINVLNIIRDIRDSPCSITMKDEESIVAFITNRLTFAKNCKAHARLVVTEKPSEALKLYNKGAGALKRIPKKKRKELDLISEKEGKESLREFIKDLNEVDVTLRLNLALCDEKLEDWDKMKQHSEELLKDYPDESFEDYPITKAYYRAALANFKLKKYASGFQQIKVAFKREPNNKTIQNLYKKLKALNEKNNKSKKNKMEGFLNQKEGKYQQLITEDAKKIEFEEKVKALNLYRESQPNIGIYE